MLHIFTNPFSTFMIKTCGKADIAPQETSSFYTLKYKNYGSQHLFIVCGSVYRTTQKFKCYRIAHCDDCQFDIVAACL
jgi:hypothetical protein